MATWTSTVVATAPSDAVALAVAMAVATANAAHSAMSSSTAAPSRRLAKRVCRTPRSWKILLMTGIDVTAVAMAKISTRAGLLSAGPISALSGSAAENSSARRNGSVVPSPMNQAVGLRFSLPSASRTLAPEMNMSSSRPRW